MADIANPTIEADLQPEPGKPVLTVGVGIVAVLFLGLNLGLRGFSNGAETPTEPFNENLLATPKTATTIPSITYEQVTRLPETDRKAEKQTSAPAPRTRTQAKQQPSGSSEEQQAAWRSPLFPPSALALRQVQPQQVVKNPLDSALAKLADIQLPTPQDLFPQKQPSATERNEAFLTADNDDENYVRQGLQGPVSPYEVKAGSIIPAALITGLNSDLPGQIIGQTTEPVFDTVTGQHLLIPQGTKIIGRYNANVGYAQNRLQIVWDRLIMPNGNSIGLDAMIGTDKTGAAGLKDEVDYHTSSLIGAVFLSSFISAGANLATDSSADGSFIDDLGDTAAQQAASIGSNIISRQLDVQPTITVSPGFKLNILVRPGYRPGTPPMSGITKRRKLLFGVVTVTICGTLTLGMTSGAPLILYPITPSLPSGLYIRTFEPPKVGMIAAFRIPDAAKRYKASIGEHVHDDFLFMKPIVAGPGDHVCRRSSGRVDVNGVRIARTVIQHKIHQLQPPLWQICRPLANNEFFMMSIYLPNSFDSRHFGPVRRRQILGVYRSLIVDQRRPRL